MLQHNFFKICSYHVLTYAKALNLRNGKIAVAAMAGILEIGAATTMITAYGQTSQEQPPVTSNDECLPGSVVHCIDDEENPPNSNEECLPGSAVHCIDDDDHGNLRDLFELNVDELLQLDVNDLLERFGHNN
jgi:hypothetical protein